MPREYLWILAETESAKLASITVLICPNNSRKSKSICKLAYLGCSYASDCVPIKPRYYRGTVVGTETQSHAS